MAALKYKAASVWRGNGPLATIVACYCLVGIWYSVAIPPGEAVDEVQHFLYVRYVKDTWALPTQPWGGNGRPLIVSMGHHPPLYYVLGAALISPIDTTDADKAFVANPRFVWRPNYGGDGWNAFLHPTWQRFPYGGAALALQFLRWWGLCLGVLALIAFWKLGCLALPRAPWIVVLATGLLAFNPSFVFMTIGVHHDVLLTCLFAFNLLWLGRAICNGDLPRGKRAAAGAVLLASALLAKASALSLLPLYVLVIGWLGWRSRSLARTVRAAGIMFAIAALLAGWWFARNQVLYGDPLGWRMFLSVHSHMVRQGEYTWRVFWQEFLPQLQSTFWAGFGYMHITLPDPFWRALTLAFWASCVAAWAGLACTRGAVLAERNGMAILALMALAAVLLFLSFVRFSMATAGAGHGRYLFPAGGALMTFMAIGLNALTGFRCSRSTAILGSASMLAYAIVPPMLFVMPLYRGPTVLRSATMPEGPGVASFGDQLRLVKADVPGEGTLPGQKMKVVFYWEPLRESLPDIGICLRLTDRYGNELVRECTWPIPSFSTVAWERGCVYVGQHAIKVPENASLGVGTLLVSARVGQDGPVLLPSSADKSGLVDEWIPVARPLIGRMRTVASLSLPPERTCRFVFGQEIILLGYELARRREAASDALALTLYWQARQPPEHNYVVFVHILDETGRLVAQQDGEPCAGQCPTAAWPAGAIVVDRHQAILLPEGLQAGQYRVVVGMYTWPGLERLLVAIDDEPAGDAATVATLNIPG